MRPIGTTQPVTEHDQNAGMIRIPQDTKRHLPAEKVRIRVLLSGVQLNDVLYDPNDRERARSGRLRVGVDAARRHTKVGQRLSVSLGDDGSFRLA